jgi:hypothetical protein
MRIAALIIESETGKTQTVARERVTEKEGSDD